MNNTCTNIMDLMNLEIVFICLGFFLKERKNLLTEVIGEFITFLIILNKRCHFEQII